VSVAAQLAPAPVARATARDNPRTSSVVPFAVLRSLSVLVGRPVRIV
jgi:hypothetical protein